MLLSKVPYTHVGSMAAESSFGKPQSLDRRVFRYRRNKDNDPASGAITYLVTMFRVIASCAILDISRSGPLLDLAMESGFSVSRC
ncbi:hypothetical protein DPMN_093543 [Dreissena polymorpha]|uniref:Uncharacterized protein n=1 Tax=Dreissena polymorpha TaxID=45954 RepID=A0A9D4L424_DREPO|nr:hypothetical protein DPMN_093543 [Dreissena polymorpha]